MLFPLQYLIPLQELNRVYEQHFQEYVDTLLFTQEEHSWLHSHKFPDAYHVQGNVVVRTPKSSDFPRYIRHVRSKVYDHFEHLSVQECAPYLPTSPAILILDKQQRVLVRKGIPPYTNVWGHSNGILTPHTLSPEEIDRVLRDESKILPTPPSDETLFRGVIPSERRWKGYILHQKTILGNGACYLNSILFALNVKGYRDIQLKIDQHNDRTGVDELLRNEYNTLVENAMGLPLVDFFRRIPLHPSAWDFTKETPLPDPNLMDDITSNRIQRILQTEEGRNWLETIRTKIVEKHYTLRTKDTSYPYFDDTISKKLISERYQVNIHVFAIRNHQLVLVGDAMAYGDPCRYDRNVLLLLENEHYECLTLEVFPHIEHAIYQCVFPNLHPLLQDIQDTLKTNNVYTRADMNTLNDIESDLEKIRELSSTTDPILQNKRRRILERLHLFLSKEGSTPDVDTSFSLTYEELRDRLGKRVLPVQDPPIRYTEIGRLALLQMMTYILNKDPNKYWVNNTALKYLDKLKPLFSTSPTATQLFEMLQNKRDQIENSSSKSKSPTQWNIFDNMKRVPKHLWGMVQKPEKVKNNNVSSVKQNSMPSKEKDENRSYAIPFYVTLVCTMFVFLYILYEKSGEILQHDMNEFVLIKQNHFDMFVEQVDIAFVQFTKSFLFQLKAKYRENPKVSEKEKERLIQSLRVSDMGKVSLPYQTETNNRALRFYLQDDFSAFLRTQELVKDPKEGWTFVRDMFSLREQLRWNMLNDQETYHTLRFFQVSELEYIDAQNLHGFPIHSVSMKHVGILRHVLFTLSILFFFSWSFSLFYLLFVFTPYSEQLYKRIHRGKEHHLMFDKPERKSVYYLSFIVNLILFVLTQLLWEMVNQPEVYVGISKRKGAVQRHEQLFWTLDIPIYYNMVRYTIFILSLIGMVLLGFLFLQYRQFPLKNHEKTLFGGLFTLVVGVSSFMVYRK